MSLEHDYSSYKSHTTQEGVVCKATLYAQATASYLFIMAPFTVVIIGGGVAGLTLANVLERYGIEYFLLEKHKEIAPQLGASIGILPYGSQLLDQLGMEGQISSLCESVETMQTFGPDGECLTTEPAFGQLLADL